MITSNLILRIGLAFAFLYPPLREIVDPQSWLAYLPTVMRHLPISELTVLHSFGFLEVVLALWILSGKKIQYPATLAAILLIAIVVFNRTEMDILFRDLSIAAMAVALAVDSWRQKSLAPPM